MAPASENDELTLYPGNSLANYSYCPNEKRSEEGWPALLDAAGARGMR